MEKKHTRKRQQAMEGYKKGSFNWRTIEESKDESKMNPRHTISRSRKMHKIHNFKALTSNQDESKNVPRIILF